ncbi:MAG: 3-deoxy-manno-octulosonate cytidylyltransferase [Elusimicrobiota bacterium]|jgi:3-deoxy-manno-octulosonate cytidylyltransferase (CMP-KDO synthetase)|nr:3-deoxy-manno-octulosonate cytidylyltransferase [Elusimicrobiota bacterium]
MKIIGVIPSRYNSTRFPGKPLVDICGKPMIWWVYNQVKKVNKIDDIVVATDNQSIEKVCNKYEIPSIITSENHPEHISRIHEVSEKIKADYYLCINGDEPLIDPKSIQKIIPNDIIGEKIDFLGAMRILKNPAETIDISNIKVVVNSHNRCIYMSRNPIPCPKGSLMFNYYKYIGIECFTKSALDFFINTPIGNLEKIEDIDHLRFIENNIEIKFNLVESDSISVDTPKDLEKVREIIKDKIEKGLLSNE